MLNGIEDTLDFTGFIAVNLFFSTQTQNTNTQIKAQQCLILCSYKIYGNYDVMRELQHFTLSCTVFAT